MSQTEKPGPDQFNQLAVVVLERNGFTMDAKMGNQAHKDGKVLVKYNMLNRSTGKRTNAYHYYDENRKTIDKCTGVLADALNMIRKHELIADEECAKQ